MPYTATPFAGNPAAIDLLTGVTRWEFDGEAENRGGIHSSVAIDQERKLAFYGTPAANFYAVDITTGKQRCQIQVQSPTTGAFIWSSPLVINDLVYVGPGVSGRQPLRTGRCLCAGPRHWRHGLGPLHGSGGCAGRRCLVVADR